MQPGQGPSDEQPGEPWAEGNAAPPRFQGHWVDPAFQQPQLPPASSPPPAPPPPPPESPSDRDQYIAQMAWQAGHAQAMAHAAMLAAQQARYYQQPTQTHIHIERSSSGDGCLAAFLITLGLAGMGCGGLLSVGAPIFGIPIFAFCAIGLSIYIAVLLSK